MPLNVAVHRKSIRTNDNMYIENSIKIYRFGDIGEISWDQPSYL